MKRGIGRPLVQPDLPLRGVVAIGDIERQLDHHVSAAYSASLVTAH